MSLLFVHLLHIFIIAGILGYVYATRSNALWVGILGLAVAAYHGTMLFKTRRAVFAFHVLISTLLMYIGFTRPDKDSFAYQVLLALIFAVVGYHGYKALVPNASSPTGLES
jgi:hypothetical protein